MISPVPATRARCSPVAAPSPSSSAPSHPRRSGRRPPWIPRVAAWRRRRPPRACAGPWEGTPGIPVTLLPLKEVRGGAEELRRGLQGRRGISVADAETDADLEALARAGLAQGSLLLAGSAGLAGAVSAALGLTSRPVACP